MGTGKSLKRPAITRPKKTPAERRRREKVQRRRLTALGVPEAEVDKMTTADLREMLRRPEKVRAQYSK